MQLIIDVREGCMERKTGKGQWVRGFVTELLSRSQDVVLCTDRALPQIWSSIIPKTWNAPSGLRWHFRTARFVKNQTEDCIYVSPTSFIVPSILPKAVKCVPIIHDLIAFMPQPHDRKAQIIERLLLKKAVQKAYRICVTSESTKHDLLEQTHIDPAHITPVYAGPMDEDPPQCTPDGKTILCAGTLCPRKNQLRLIQAYKELPKNLRSRYRLILIGARGWHDRSIIQEARKTDGVTWKGHVPDEEYQKYFHTCSVLALPSLYEGFGLPILDALQRGTPVLTSDRGSLKEVAGSAAVVVDPYSVPSIAQGLDRILTDEKKRKELQQAGPVQAQRYSWKRTVDLFLRTVHDIHP